MPVVVLYGRGLVAAESVLTEVDICDGNPVHEPRNAEPYQALLVPDAFDCVNPPLQVSSGKP